MRHDFPPVSSLFTGRPVNSWAHVPGNVTVQVGSGTVPPQPLTLENGRERLSPASKSAWVRVSLFPSATSHKTSSPVVFFLVVQQ